MKPRLQAVNHAPVTEGDPIVQFYTPVATDRQRTDFLVADLSKGAQLVVWSMRKWVEVRYKKRHSGSLVYRTAYRLAGIPQAAEILDEMLMVLATTSLRPVLVECPCCQQLSTDELMLLSSLRSLQLMNTEAATRRMTRVLSGSLSNAFCRSAQAYVDQLTSANLSLEQITQLGLVQNDRDPS
ncbi:MAG: hypothetical protein JJ921_15360 [Pseudomonadales bacterium]|nr:hypothetical protein [Pseudomonadales bacterium]MBO7004225.1 hypothetical protein [Pseudomonadales bacterium]